DQALQVYKKLDYFEKHLNDLQLADLQKIQSTYLTYSLAFGKCPVIQFDVLPKHDERQCRKVVRF
ncbi:MAG TPA: hypothetical protein VHM20_06320, partial [Gammaproteobacteria bacterium]|nr:hypothetical protein [Gammaproteobacteria bacterium]